MSEPTSKFDYSFVNLRRSLRTQLPRAVPFFLVTLVTILTLHLIEKPTRSEIAEAAFASLVFTAFFLVGSETARRWPVGRSRDVSVLREAMIGFGSAAVMWLLLWSAASIAPWAFHGDVKWWGFVVLPVVLGVVTGRARG